MSSPKSFAYYQAGQAVAAVHLNIAFAAVSADPAQGAGDFSVPRDQPKMRMILWLTGLAAERKGMGASDPLRRTRTRVRLRALLRSMRGSAVRPGGGGSLLNQAQDRANAICGNRWEAIDKLAERLSLHEVVPGEEVLGLVRAVRAERRDKVHA